MHFYVFLDFILHSYKKHCNCRNNMVEYLWGIIPENRIKYPKIGYRLEKYDYETHKAAEKKRYF